MRCIAFHLKLQRQTIQLSIPNKNVVLQSWFSNVGLSVGGWVRHSDFNILKSLNVSTTCCLKSFCRLTLKKMDFDPSGCCEDEWDESACCYEAVSNQTGTAVLIGDVGRVETLTDAVRSSSDLQSDCSPPGSSTFPPAALSDSILLKTNQGFLKFGKKTFDSVCQGSPSRWGHCQPSQTRRSELVVTWPHKLVSIGMCLPGPSSTAGGRPLGPDRTTEITV